MQEQVDYTQFPIRGDFATIKEDGNLKKILFFFRNITVELTQEYILNTALQRTRIYPWYYDKTEVSLPLTTVISNIWVFRPEKITL